MRILSNVENVVIGILILAMSLLAFTQVLSRYVFEFPLPWIEELTRYLMIWMVMIGAALGVAKKANLGVDIMELILSPGKQRVLNAILMGLIMTLSLVLFMVSSQFTLDQIDVGQLSPAMQVPMATVTLAMVVGTLLMSIQAGHQLINLVTGRTEKDFKEEEQ